MTIPSNILPSKCCCCSLRAGSIVVGSFSLIFSLIFLGLSAAASSGMAVTDCRYMTIYGERKYVCVPAPEMYRTGANAMALLSILNAVEVVMSVGLIWGASKRILSWVNAYLMTTACWIFLHSVIAIAYIFATMETAFIILISVVGLLVLGLALLCMLTVYSFRKEILGSRLVSLMQNPPTALSSEAARNQSSFSGQPQYPIMQTVASAPAVSHICYE